MRGKIDEKKKENLHVKKTYLIIWLALPFIFHTKALVRLSPHEVSAAFRQKSDQFVVEHFSL